MKTFLIIHSVLGFTFFPLNFASPVGDMGTVVPRATSLDDLGTSKNVISSVQSSATKAAHAHIDQLTGTLSLKEDKEDLKVVGAEESLMKLQKQREALGGVDFAIIQPKSMVVSTTTSIEQSKASEVFKCTLTCLQKEEEAYHELGHGLIANAIDLIKEATENQQLAASALKFSGKIHIDADEYQQLKQADEFLANIREKYFMLPTKEELMAVIHSLNEEYPMETLKISGLPKNQDTSSLAEKQGKATEIDDHHPPKSALDKGTMNLIEHQDTERLLNHSEKSSMWKGPIKMAAKKLFGIGQSAMKTVTGLKEGLSIRSEAIRAIYLEGHALESLHNGDRATAVEYIQHMQSSRKSAIARYEAYQRNGHGTIDMSAYDGWEWRKAMDELTRLRGDEPTAIDINSERLDEIKKKINLEG